MSSNVFNSVTGGRNAGLSRITRNSIGRSTAQRMSDEARSRGEAIQYRFNSRRGVIYGYRTDGSGSP